MALGGSGGGGGGGAGAIRAGAAYVELSLRDNLSGQLANAEKRFNAAGKSLAIGGAGAFGVGAAVAGPLLGGAIGELEELAKLNSAAKALGTTGEGASGLFGALKSVGGDFKEDLEGITQFIAKVNDAAAGKGGDAAKLFEGLNVSAQDLMKVPLEEKFYRVVGAIRDLPQEDQIGKLSMLGGTDSMKKWLDLLAISNKELRNRGAAASVAQVDLDRATEATRAYAVTTASLSRAWREVVIGVAPAVTFLADQTNKLLGPGFAWIRDNRELATVAVAGAVALMGLGAAMIAGSVALSAFGVVLAAVKAIAAGTIAVLSAFASPVGLIILAVAGLGYLFFTQTNMGREWADAIGEYFSTTASNAMSAWQGAKTAIGSGDLGLAAKIGIKFLEIEWERFSSWLGLLWSDAIDLFQSGWDNAGYVIQGTFIDLMDGIDNIVVNSIKFMFTRFEQETRGFMNFLGNALKGIDDEFSRSLLLIADAPRDKVLRAFDAVGKKNDGEHQAERNRLQKELQDAEDARANARGAKVEEAAARVAALQAELAQLNQKAAEGARVAVPNAPGGAKAIQLADSIGAFNLGGFTARAFGDRATSTVPVQQLKAAELTNIKLDKMIDILDRDNGGVFEA